MKDKIEVNLGEEIVIRLEEKLVINKIVIKEDSNLEEYLIKYLDDKNDLVNYKVRSKST